MNTRDLIRKLQEADPSGTLQVCVDNDPVLGVSKLPAYYDGPLMELVGDGVRFRDSGEKVSIECADIGCMLMDNPDLSVDLEDLSPASRDIVAGYVEKLRNEAAGGGE